MTTVGRRVFVAGLAGAAVALPAGTRVAGAQGTRPAAVKRVRQASEARTAGEMELFRLADAPSTPTGIAVSRDGRVFVFMPRFDATVPFTVGEVAPDGRVTPYPDATANQPDPVLGLTRFFHAPNGVVDRRDDSLWILDAALPDGAGPPVPGAAKLVQIDLASNAARRTVPLDAGLVPTSSLNDLRVGRLDGRSVAFVSDQGQTGEGAILAVDLGSGRVLRRLAGHDSTRSQPGLVKFVEHRPVMLTRNAESPQPPKGGANGIALSADGARLFFAPLMGRRLHAVATAARLDPAVPDATIAAAVEDLGEKGMTGGLAADAMGRVYLALQEQNAVGRREPNGTIEVIASDPRLVWADTISITPDRWLYVNGAQVNRRPEYNGGVDRQEPPYAILRIRIDADPA